MFRQNLLVKYSKISNYIFTKHSIVTFYMDTFYVSEFYLYVRLYCVLKKN